MLDLAPLVPWLSLLALAFSVGAAIFNVLTSGSREAKAEMARLALELKSVDDKTDGLSGRINTIETTLRQLPDKDSLHRVEIGLERMNGELNTLNERLKPIDHLSRRLQDVMLSEARTK